MTDVPGNQRDSHCGDGGDQVRDLVLQPREALDLPFPALGLLHVGERGVEPLVDDPQRLVADPEVQPLAFCQGGHRAPLSSGSRTPLRAAISRFRFSNSSRSRIASPYGSRLSESPEMIRSDTARKRSKWARRSGGMGSVWGRENGMALLTGYQPDTGASGAASGTETDSNPARTGPRTEGVSGPRTQQRQSVPGTGDLGTKISNLPAFEMFLALNLDNSQRGRQTAGFRPVECAAECRGTSQNLPEDLRISVMSLCAPPVCRGTTHTPWRSRMSRQQNNHPSTSNLDRYVGYMEAAAYLGVSKATIVRIVNSGLVEVVYVTPSTPRLKLDELVAALKEVNS